MKGSLAIPERLRQQFEALERRLWRFDLLLAVSGGLGSLLISYTLIFVLDRLGDTPAIIRGIVALVGWLALGFFAFRFGSRWIWGNRSLPVLATLVQKRYRALGDRLLGIVELADESRRPENFSEALCKAAIEQVSHEAASVDFQQAVHTRRPRQCLVGAAIVAVIVILFCLLAPQAGWNAAMRWAMPLSKITRYTFVNLNFPSERLVVPHGEPFTVSLDLGAQSLMRPGMATGQIEKQNPLKVPLANGGFTFKFPGQSHPGWLYVRAGDATRKIWIEPTHRPALQALNAHLELPAYLEYPQMDQVINGGALSVLKGTKIKLTGQTNRNLQSAFEGEQKLDVDANRFFSKQLTLDSASTLSFTWRDEFGLNSAAARVCKLDPKEDEAPRVDCPGLPAAVAILEEEVVHIKLAASDDFGLQGLGVQWETVSTRKPDEQSSTAAPAPEPPKPAPVDKKLLEGTPQSQTLDTMYDFSPALLKIPADTLVTFTSYAADRYPGRAPSHSRQHQIYVLSREAHARLVQQQLEKLAARLEEIGRRQEALLNQGKELREKSPDKLAGAEAEKDLAAQAAEQQATAEELKKLAQQMQESLKEALRNKDIDPATLQEMAAESEAMEQLADQQMAQASQSLSDAKSDPKNRSSKMDKAIAEESEILKKLKELQKAEDQSLNKMNAQNLAMRLRNIAGTETQVASTLKQMLPEMIGMQADQLPEKARKAVGDLASRHDTGRKDSTKLQAEIGRFFERTKQKPYGDVASQMEKANPDEGLEKLAQLLAKNVATQAIQDASTWAKRYEEWADLLTPPDDDEGQQGGEGQGGQGDDKAMRALMRLRQNQDTVREQTAALERQKAANPNYNKAANDAAQQQGSTLGDLKELMEDPSFPVPEEQLAPIGKAMEDAKGLLEKPETGEPTIAAQTDALNMLDAVIMSQSKKGKGGKGMASMMKMMGVGQSGQTPGGSTAGGDAHGPNELAKGNRTGAAPGERHVEQAVGTTQAPLPAEFRTAIENYQRAIDKAGP